jgi:hypothetical protein
MMPAAAPGPSKCAPSSSAAPASQGGGSEERRRGPRYKRSLVSASAVDLRSTAARYRLRDWIARRLRRGDGRGPAVSGCGIPAHNVEEIEWRVSRDGRTRPANTLRCKSAVVCPVCAVWQARKLQDRLQGVAEAAVAAGGSVGMQTLTLRHHRGHDLQCLRRVATEALHRVVGGRGWLRLKREGGLLGQAKVVEAPWGPAHGWHPHLHLLLVFDHRDEERAHHAAERMEARWIAEVTALGFGALPAGQRFEPCYDVAGAAGYCAKLAAELAHGWAKESTGHGRDALIGIFAIAHRAMTGDREADRLFLEYAQAMSGMQQGRVSRPLREALQLFEQEAIEGDGTKDRGGETVGCQSREQYMALYACGRLPDLAALIESQCPPDVGIGGWPRVSEWIEATLRPPPRSLPPEWRVSAERIAREVRARRAAFAGTSTAELVAKALHEYRSRPSWGLLVVLPDPKAVLAELASN